MNVLPLVARELRATSRQALTHWLRVLGVAALVVEGVVFGLNHGIGADVGGQLFGWLHLVLVGAIWVLAPLLVSRPRWVRVSGRSRPFR
jgi:hypothetical protein